MFIAFASLLCMSALLAWVNERFVKLPTTIGVTLASTFASFILVVTDKVGVSFGLRDWAAESMRELNFTDFVLNGILSVLLFAGAMSLDARRFVRQRWSISALALFSTTVSTFLVACGTWGLSQMVGVDLPFLWALLFGALISPTDPVAVLDLLQRVKAPKKIETIIAGESLFNDGVGVVIFAVVASLAGAGTSHTDPTALGALTMFAQEALGGMLLGLILGIISYGLISTIYTDVVELMITFATVIGGYALAHEIGVSGPLAMVVTGLFLSARKQEAFGDTGKKVEDFWETLEHLLDVMLFAFIGFEVMLINPSLTHLLLAVALVPVVLASRLISVAGPIRLLKKHDGYGPYTTRLLTWAGLRGGIAVALVLSLPANLPHRADLVTATFVVVLFSIAVQGMTITSLLQKCAEADPERESVTET